MQITEHFHEDIYIALMPLPPEALVPLLEFEDEYLKPLKPVWRMKLGVAPPGQEQVEMLGKGWHIAKKLKKTPKYKQGPLNDALADISEPDLTAPTTPTTLARLRNDWCAKPRKDSTVVEEKRFERTSESLEQHHSLHKLLSDESYPIAAKSLGTIARLAKDNKFWHFPANPNVLTIEDVLSFLPEQHITTPTIYRLIEASTFKNSNCDVIPPAALDLYHKDPSHTHAMHLALFFTLPELDNQPSRATKTGLRSCLGYEAFS